MFISQSRRIIVYRALVAIARPLVKHWKTDYLVHDRSFVMTEWNGKPFFYLVRETGTQVFRLSMLTEMWAGYFGCGVDMEKAVTELFSSFGEHMYYHNGVDLFKVETFSECAAIIESEHFLSKVVRGEE